MHFNTLHDFILYRNKMLIRAKARTLKFKDNKKNYYWYRLDYINSLYPEYSKLGVITLK
jgi:hypothetical protein